VPWDSIRHAISAYVTGLDMAVARNPVPESESFVPRSKGGPSAAQVRDSLNGSIGNVDDTDGAAAAVCHCQCPG